jgi:hypothetical protein
MKAWIWLRALAGVLLFFTIGAVPLRGADRDLAGGGRLLDGGAGHARA